MSVERILARLRPTLGQVSAYQSEIDLGEDALDANENPYSPPARFTLAAAKAVASAHLNRYPDSSAKRLRAAAAAHYGVAEDCLLFGNGSDEFLTMLFLAFGGDGATVLLPSPTFSMYAQQARAAGWAVIEEPLDQDFQLSEAFVQKARAARPKLIFLANPNNPTGNLFRAETVRELLSLEDVVVVLDEAYAEFASVSGLADLEKNENLVVLRTLSKAFGLAGLRVGILAGHARLVAELNKVRLPYNLGTLTLEMASIALECAKDFEPRIEELRIARAELAKALGAMPGARVWPSDANFILFFHPEAEHLRQFLLERRLRLRRFKGGVLDGCLRLSVGDKEQNTRLFQAIHDFVFKKAVQ